MNPFRLMISNSPQLILVFAFCFAGDSIAEHEPAPECQGDPNCVWREVHGGEYYPDESDTGQETSNQSAAPKMSPFDHYQKFKRQAESYGSSSSTTRHGPGSGSGGQTAGINYDDCIAQIQHTLSANTPHLSPGGDFVNKMKVSCERVNGTNAAGAKLCIDAWQKQYSIAVESCRQNATSSAGNRDANTRPAQDLPPMPNFGEPINPVQQGAGVNSGCSSPFDVDCSPVSQGGGFDEMRAKRDVDFSSTFPSIDATKVRPGQMQPDGSWCDDVSVSDPKCYPEPPEGAYDPNLPTIGACGVSGEPPCPTPGIDAPLPEEKCGDMDCIGRQIRDMADTVVPVTAAIGAAAVVAIYGPTIVLTTATAIEVATEAAYFAGLLCLENPITCAHITNETRYWLNRLVDQGPQPFPTDIHGMARKIGRTLILKLIEEAKKEPSASDIHSDNYTGKRAPNWP
jgi:hypothetical protein